MKNKLILWDIDGTIMGCGGDGAKAMNLAFEELYGITDAFSKIKIGVHMDTAVLLKILDSFGLDKADLGKIILSYGRHLERALKSNQEIKIYPGIPELLDYISGSKQHFQTLLTSNLRIGAKKKLELVGLWERFHTGGFGDFPEEKWDTAIRAITETEKYYEILFDKEDIYMIGDSFYDVECAKHLGVKSIAVATGWTSAEVLAEHGPDYLFSDLSDYQRVIQIIGGNDEDQRF